MLEMTDYAIILKNAVTEITEKNLGWDVLDKGFMGRNIQIKNTTEFVDIVTDDSLCKKGIYFTKHNEEKGEYAVGVLIIQNDQESTLPVVPVFFNLVRYVEPVLETEDIEFNALIAHLRVVIEATTFSEFIHYMQNLSHGNNVFDLLGTDDMLKTLPYQTIPTVGYWIDENTMDNLVSLPTNYQQFMKEHTELFAKVQGDIFVSEKLWSQGFYVHYDLFHDEHSCFEKEYQLYIEDVEDEDDLPFTGGILSKEQLKVDKGMIDFTSSLRETAANKKVTLTELLTDSTSYSYSSVLLIELNEERTAIKKRYLLTVDCDNIQAVAIFKLLDSLL